MIPRMLRRLLFAALVLSGCAGAYLGEAKHAYSIGDYERARYYAAAALRDDPNYPPARQFQAQLFIGDGVEAFNRHDLTTARHNFEEARNLDPTNEYAPRYLEQVRDAEQGHAVTLLEAPRLGPPPAPVQHAAPQPPAEHRRETPAPPAPKVASASGPTLRRAVPLYDAPSPLAGELAKLPAGASITALHAAGAWTEVETRDGKRGYVATDAIE